MSLNAMALPYGDTNDTSNLTSNDEIARKEDSTVYKHESAFMRPSKAQIKRATRTRLIWAQLSSFLLLVSLVFLILVEVGSTHVGPVVSNIYFIRLYLANIVPNTVPNARLINSIAQTIGLHDFYTVGLWGFCYGDNGKGFQHCSKPRILYWFNPVSIIESELLAGASISLPAQVSTILHLVRLISHWMFALFLSGACLTFVMIFLTPIVVYTRWASLPIATFTFVAALFTTVASVLATAMFVIMRNALTDVAQLNIGAWINVQMFVFMWIASGTAIFAFLIQFSLLCCCASRRDVRRGRKRGSKKAWS